MPADTCDAETPPQRIYGAWRSAAIGGGGYVQNVVAAPSRPGRLYAYVDVGGLARSDDNGESWHMLHGNLPPLAGVDEVRSLVTHPTDAGQIIIAVGSAWGAGGEGIYRSTDAGETWTRTLRVPFLGNGEHRWDGVLLSRDDHDPRRVLAASVGEGCWVSNDEGLTWKPTGLRGVYPTDLKLDGSFAYLCGVRFKGYVAGKGDVDLEGGAGFYRSADRGETWEKLGGGGDDGPTEVVVTPAGLLGGFNGRSIRLSHDHGKTWIAFDEGLATLEKTPGSEWTSPDRFFALACDGSTLVATAADGTMYRRQMAWNTQDREPAWTRVQRKGVRAPNWWYAADAVESHFGKAAASIVPIMSASGRYLFITDWFAIWKSEDDGSTWRFSADGIESTVIHALTPDPSRPGLVHLGMADNGYFRSLTGGQSFRPNRDVITNNVKDIALSRAEPNRVYAVGPAVGGNWYSNELFISPDAGATWRASPMLGLPALERMRINTVSVSPVDARRVWLAVATLEGKSAGDGGGGVYVSTDGGRTFSPEVGGLREPERLFQAEIWGVGREMAVGADGAMIVAGRRARVIAVRPARDGHPWSVVKQDVRDIRAVAADPFTAGHYLVATGDKDGLLQSFDSGANWTTAIPGEFSAVAFDPLVRGQLAASSVGAVHLSTDGGKSWRDVAGRLPGRTKVTALAFAGERLLVGTNGSGAFWMPLVQLAETDVKVEPPACARRQLLSLVNGNFEAPGTPPPGWSLSWTGNGTLSVSVEAEGSSPATNHFLQLRTATAGSYGTASQVLSADAREFEVRGRGRARGPALVEAWLVLQGFNDQGVQRQFTVIADLKQHPIWTSFNTPVSLEQGVKRAQLSLILKGDGSACIDDIELVKPIEVFDAVSK